MAIEVIGNWRKGLAFDVHTLSSTYLGPDQFGHDQWENVRSEMGELVYKLKYQKDKDTLPKIVSLLDTIKGFEKFDYIVPIPPTDMSRGFQPVTEIALALGARYGIEVLTDVLIKRPGSQQLKNIHDPDKRKDLLRNSLQLVGECSLAGRDILLVDDLFRSGATLSAAAELLYQEAEAKEICVLTMTKTRSNR